MLLTYSITNYKNTDHIKNEGEKLLDTNLFRAAPAQGTLKESTAQAIPLREIPKQMTAKELHKQMGIAFSVVASPLQSNDAILNHIPSDKEYLAHFGPTKQMSLKQLRDEMGISFQLV
jgi:hypothetical protein